MNKRNWLFLCCFFSMSYLFSQNKVDTVFYNSKWQQTEKDSASYYSIISRKNDTLFEVKDFYKNSQIQMSGVYKKMNPNIKNGYFTYYSERGLIKQEGSYSLNERDGCWKSYSNSGRIIKNENFHNGKLEGELKMYYESGIVKRLENYKKGELLSGKCFGVLGNDTLYFPYEIFPSFVGGEEALYKYLAENVQYPEDARQMSIKGRVNVKFVVYKDGSIGDISVTKSVYSSLDQEAVRVIRNMPKWIPGRQDGVNVDVYFIIPILFKLNKN